MQTNFEGFYFDLKVTSSPAINIIIIISIIILHSARNNDNCLH